MAPLDERNKPRVSDWIWSKCGKNLAISILLLCIVGFVCGLSFGLGVDWFLAAVLGVSVVILFLVNTYLVVMWSDPQDAESSIWQMLLVITALSLAEGAILALPLDVANNSNSMDCSNSFAKSAGDCGNLNMTTFWEVLIVCIFGYVVVLLPMAIFQYESYDEVEVLGKKTNNKQAFCNALYWEMGVLVVTGLTLGLMYAFLGTAEVPVTTLSMDVGTTNKSEDSKKFFYNLWSAGQSVAFADVGSLPGFEAFTASVSGFNLGTSNPLSACANDASPSTSQCTNEDTDTIMEIKTSFATYMAALTAWVGWFIFVIFGGIGLAALPGDLLRKYTHRPVIKTPAQLAGEQKLMQARTNELIKLGNDLKKDREEWHGSAGRGWREKSRRKVADKNNVNKFKQMVFVLESDFELWEACKGQSSDYNPLHPYLCLVGGLLASALTLLWVLHICLYVIVPEPDRFTLFLNLYFMQFDDWFPLFGILSVALFAGYLLCCVISGIFKVGVRCFCMDLHPMRYGKTLMNAFMFNTLWIMLCSLPVVQFSVEAFDTYARYTSIATLLGVQVKYLKFFKYFFVDKVFVYCLLAIFGLSVAVLGYKPKDEAASTASLKKKLQHNRRSGK